MAPAWSLAWREHVVGMVAPFALTTTFIVAAHVSGADPPECPESAPITE